MISDLSSLIKQIQQERDIFQKARLIDYLKNEGKLRIVDLSVKLKLKPSYICHLMRLKKIPDIIVDGYYSKSITSSHIYLISRLNDKQQMIELYEKILGENYSVIQTEEAVREYLYQIKSTGRYLSKDNIERLTKKIRERYSDLELKIIQTRIKGKIIMEVKGNLEKSSNELKKILIKLSNE
jgi:ParB family transcriptional regulator, chromosome partitioning protein